MDLPELQGVQTEFGEWARPRPMRRPKRLRARRPPVLHLAEILAWADAHHQRTGRWPGAKSGLIVDAPGEMWRRINAALRLGLRGLPGGSSLARLMNRDPDQAPDSDR